MKFCCSFFKISLFIQVENKEFVYFDEDLYLLIKMSSQCTFYCFQSINVLFKNTILALYVHPPFRYQTLQCV